MGVLVSLIFVALILVILFLYFSSEFAFKKAFHEHKKNKNEAFKVLEKRGMLDEKIYNEVNMEEVQITSKDNLCLKGVLIEKFKESNRYIILVHGYSANRHIHMPFVRMFLKEGFNILLVDQRNHGDSEGDFPSYGYYEQEDLNRWIDYLEERKGKELFLGLHGQSMGGATVLMCGAKNNKVKFIIDDCGYSSGEEIMKFQIGKVKRIPINLVYKVLDYKVRKRYGFTFKDVSPIKDICNTDKPILFIHGNKDVTVPYEMAINMYKARNNSKDKILIVEECGHMTAIKKNKEEYEKIVHEFIENI